MAATPTPLTRADGAAKFGAGRLFVTDSRLAILVLDDVRHRCVRRAFGVPPELENLLTVVLAMTALSGTTRIAGRAMRMRPGAGDTAAGVLLLREGAIGIAGPSARATPMLGTLLAAAMVGGIALPGLRRAAHAASEAERRMRLERIRRYVTARRAPAE